MLARVATDWVGLGRAGLRRSTTESWHFSGVTWCYMVWQYSFRERFKKVFRRPYTGRKLRSNVYYPSTAREAMSAHFWDCTAYRTATLSDELRVVRLVRGTNGERLFVSIGCRCACSAFSRASSSSTCPTVYPLFVGVHLIRGRKIGFLLACCRCTLRPAPRTLGARVVKMTPLPGRSRGRPRSCRRSYVR